MFDLEYELLHTKFIADKCYNSEIYSQHLYAALCNNRFLKNGEQWTCSWRMSGGIVAELRNPHKEDYMDWYCSGISDKNDYVSEGFVTDEIREDLLQLGWTIKPYEPKLKPGIYRNDWGSYE